MSSHQRAVQHGLANELRAAAHLMDLGYEVFLGVGSTSCDMLAMKDGTVVRVEVKTASQRAYLDGRRRVLGVQQGKFDMLVVLMDGEVLVNPGPDVVHRT